MIKKLLSISIAILYVQILFAENGSHDESIEHLEANGRLEISEKSIMNKPVLLDIYSQNDNTYIWPDNYLYEAIEILKDSHKDGLLRKDYHYFKLVELMDKYNKSIIKSRKLRLEIDMLLTDGMISYQYHLMNGKVSPESIYKYWNYKHVNVTNNEIISSLKQSIKQKSLKRDIEALRPPFSWYKTLQEQLATYQSLAFKYKDYKIPPTKTIYPGKQSDSLPFILKRLQQLNYIPPHAPTDSTTYTADLVKPVKAYQKFHGLSIDGAIGPGTINSMNVPFQHRVNQIKASLERGRWLSDDFTNDFLLINIAGFKLTYFQHFKPVWRSEVIVGKDWTKTPVFTAKMKYIVYNPTWTVPRSITPSLVRKAQRIPHFMQSRNFELKDASGRVIDGSYFDWRSQNPNNFHYWFVQKPGANNALGKVKFMLPNSHAIYLHDTPTKQLFSKSSRDFSHGCIRVNHPLELSLKILEHDQNFSLYEQDNLLDTGDTKRVSLKHPINVFIMYWTASPETDGFYFYNDIYQRDDQLIKLLNTPMDELPRKDIHYL